MAKRKTSAQLPAFSIDWARARLKEYPDCAVAGRIVKAASDKKGEEDRGNGDLDGKVR